MTDEERESDIYDICLEKKSIYCNRKMGEETCSKCKTFKMYKLGLAEGRKGGYDQGYKKATERAYERQQDLTDTYIKDGKKIEQLGKENEALKQSVAEAEEIIVELKAHCKAVDEVNEKMKCCENCRYYAGFDFTCNVIRATKYGATKDKNGEECNNLDKWELADES